jgi:hypothetical protein
MRARLTGTVAVPCDDRSGTAATCSSRVLQPVPYTRLTVSAILPVKGVCRAVVAKLKWAVTLIALTRFKKIGSLKLKRP